MAIEYTWILWQGKKCQFRLLKWTSFIGQFVYPVGGWGNWVISGGWGKSLYNPATSFTLLEYMIIWCKIQVMINPLAKYYLIIVHQISANSQSNNLHIFKFKILSINFCNSSGNYQIIKSNCKHTYNILLNNKIWYKFQYGYETN